MRNPSSLPSRTAGCAGFRPDTAGAAERIRLALRAHLGVVAEQRDTATAFIREWRYLEGERRRYEQRLRVPFREGREHGELRTDLDEAHRRAARPLGRELGLHLTLPRPRHRRARRLLRRDPRRRLRGYDAG
ncbi:MAG TPA: hypothetical protein VNI55_02150 [Gaiellaceae bacterium]|nr:hypothetical protein [Gaiellaceae bacterium]